MKSAVMKHMIRMKESRLLSYLKFALTYKKVGPVTPNKHHSMVMLTNFSQSWYATDDKIRSGITWVLA